MFYPFWQRHCLLASPHFERHPSLDAFVIPAPSLVSRQRHPTPPPMTLYLIPTPLAPETLAFLPLSYLKDILPRLQYFFVENERTARRFLSSLQLGTDIPSLHFFVLDKDSTPASVEQYFKQVPVGADIGLLSEAGMPCIADPGALAVAYCHRKQLPVVPIPGPSSILLALVGSGLNGQSFAFHGYLPVQEAEAVKKIRFLERDALSGQAQIFMETPYRNNRLLASLTSSLREDLMLCIAANLTAPEQFLRTQTIAQWRKQPPDLHKVPTVFVLGLPK